MNLFALRRTIAPLFVLALFQLGHGQAVIKEYALNVGDLAYDATSGRLLATIPGSVPITGNQVAWINPSTGATVKSVPIGSDPKRIVLSSSGKTAFVGLNGAGAFRPLDLATGIAGVQVSLGTGSFGPRFAEDMAVLPGSETTVAVSRFRSGVSPRHDGVAIFDGSVQRTKTTQDHTGSNVIAFGSDPSTLYGLNIETTEFGLRKIKVDATGLAESLVKSNLGSGFGGNIQVLGDRVFLSNGRAFSTTDLTLQGTFSASGMLTTDAVNRRIFFLSGNGSSRTLNILNIDTYTLLDTITIPNVDGTASSLTRFGSNGIAFRTDKSELITITAKAVPEPGSILALGMAATLVLRRLRRAN